MVNEKQNYLIIIQRLLNKRN